MNSSSTPSNATSNSESGIAAATKTNGSAPANATAAAQERDTLVGVQVQAGESRYERGVIMSLHNGIASMGASLIRELRCLGNTELIQVYHCFPEELSDETSALLTRNDAMVEIIDVCTELLQNDDVFAGDEKLAKTFQSYWLKPLALYHTKLQHVLLLDADAILMRDPAALREMSGYNRTGTVFFYDRAYSMLRFLNSMSHGSQLLKYLLRRFDYAKFNLSGPHPSQQLRDSLVYHELTAHEMDSSMVLIDKRRMGKALDIIKYLIMDVRFKLKFSWGDKEAFWLAYELAQQPYFFSPWGLSLLDSVPNGDLTEHADTLCGSMAHYVPTENSTSTPELLYVNGKALLEPFPLGLDKSLVADKKSRLFNLNPTHVTPRYRRSELLKKPQKRPKSFECMDKLGSAPLPRVFYKRLLQRRTHYFAAATKFYEGFDTCQS
uniref:Nucleotide-diphospho-sugar transferase domain-containing protein n=1 Tax=Globisporangium ultimum (strain ATCC 200006 / CBS 805.95 / DAOM BR144) TaxID=431595 RepID=K3WI44_GLOUD